MEIEEVLLTVVISIVTGFIGFMGGYILSRLPK